ncbi:MAG: signal recognition particle protein [Simkaniaceae bacterium]|nr:signal recognition particle protein [Simkaniaceae bacterium]
MFGKVTERFQDLFTTISGKKQLTEDNLSQAVREIRLALLDADVNYTVVKNFIKRVKEKAIGSDLIRSVSPGDQFKKIIHDELTELMGGDEASINVKHEPSILMLCGLQGAGKTTQAAKLAAFLQKPGYKKKPLLVACDLQRPAAVEQLKTLGQQINVPVFSVAGEKNPVKVAKQALSKALKENFDVLIFDTAGRLHLNEELMLELEKLKQALNPQEILFVASSATGQDAVKTAAEFDRRLGITGTILTMLDGNTRAGAAISISEVTGKPLKFEGIGEKISDFQVFNPISMADRILGMGDIINLVKKAEEHIDEKESQKLEKKLRKATFSYQDYLDQMGKLKKMGSLKGLLKMLPGVPDLGDMDASSADMNKTEAIIFSMTQKERCGDEDLVPSRRRRLAQGSGTNIDDVNRMIKGFKRLKQMFKKMPNLKKSMLKDPDLKKHLSLLK